MNYQKEVSNLRMKYFVNYEALVLNLPLRTDLELLDHKFLVNSLSSEDEKRLLVFDKDTLKFNYLFMSCCFSYSTDQISYVTIQNNRPMEFLGDEKYKDDLRNMFAKTTLDRIESLEHHLMLETNLHIFFPVVKIKVYSEDGKEKLSLGRTSCRPLPIGNQSWVNEASTFMNRLNFHIDKTTFDEFRFHKNHKRYKLAFDYYIRSFYEFDHSSAFYLLCSALDAITGCSHSNRTKERLAKYSSILFCSPLKIEQQKLEMQNFYKLRSNFTHGKGSEIIAQNELSLREYVRKFLIAYFLIWKEMRIQNDFQMLQKLDEIDKDHSLYIKYAPATYSFVRLSEEHEKQPGGIISKSPLEKYHIAVEKMSEALIKHPTVPTCTDEKNPK